MSCEDTYMLASVNSGVLDFAFTRVMRGAVVANIILALAMPSSCMKQYSRPLRQVKQAMENLQLVFGEEVPEPAAVHVTRWSQVRPAPHQALPRGSLRIIWAAKVSLVFTHIVNTCCGAALCQQAAFVD